MPRPCSLCKHPHRAEIERAIERGDSYGKIANQYGVSKATITRHRNHLSKITQAPPQPNPIYEFPEVQRVLEELERARLEEVSDLKHYLEILNSIVLGVMREALTSGRVGIVLKAARELRQSLELIAELLYVLDRRQTTTVQVALVQSPEWIQIRETIANALEQHPEARQSVAAALEGIGNGAAS